MTTSPVPPVSADIGRVYLDTDGVRWVLAFLNPADNCEFDVCVCRVEPVRGVYPKKWVDFRTLTATDERIERNADVSTDPREEAALDKFVAEMETP